jgi:integrase
MGDYVRLLFYAGLRRNAAETLTRDQVIGEWSALRIPGAGPKKPGYIVPLSAPAVALLKARDTGGRFFSPFAREKQRLDSRLSQVAPWTLHDIRHHVRTMLSRVASPDIAERCVGHRLQGIRKVYDHYTYMPEMREALEALAKVIRGIVTHG